MFHPLKYICSLWTEEIHVNYVYLLSLSLTEKWLLSFIKINQWVIFGEINSVFANHKKRINKLVFRRQSAEFVCLNVLKPTGHVMHQQFNIQQLYALPHTVFMCFVFISEQTATCATYSINWLVFITEMESVYSAVRTGAWNKAVCASSAKG